MRDYCCRSSKHFIDLYFELHFELRADVTNVAYYDVLI